MQKNSSRTVPLRSMVEPNLAAALTKAREEAQRNLGRVNVLIAGRTGVGKSTLINSVFHGRMAATGQGEPVTQRTRLLTKEDIPLAIWDTCGLEMSNFQETLGELKRLVAQRDRESDPQNCIHVAWLCVHENGRRVEAAKVEFCQELAQYMPVLGVITKARSDNGFRSEVQQQMPEARNVVRVRALAEALDDGHPLPQVRRWARTVSQDLPALGAGFDREDDEWHARREL